MQLRTTQQAVAASHAIARTFQRERRRNCPDVSAARTDSGSPRRGFGLLVPGFLQTENYMRAVVSWKPNSATADQTLKERLARQSVLDRALVHRTAKHVTRVSPGRGGRRRLPPHATRLR